MVLLFAVGRMLQELGWAPGRCTIMTKRLERRKYEKKNKVCVCAGSKGEAEAALLTGYSEDVGARNLLGNKEGTPGLIYDSCLLEGK